MLTRLICATVALFLLFTPHADAQVLYGSVVGTVEDPSGAVVPNAKVTLKNAATGAIREGVTDEGGRFSLQSVLAGSYELSVVANGFRTLTREGVDVAINTVTRADVKLEVGQVSDTVRVAADAVQLQTDKSEVKTELTSQTISNMPLPGYRNYQSLMNLVPGATPAAFQNAVVDTPGRALTTNINGTARNNNNTLTDGAVNINIWLPHHTAYVQPVESIETVNISTNSFDAEQGMAGGAAITVTTKSGTNDLHGVGYWFHNNQHLLSAPYFRPNNFTKPLNILNIAGGTIGGPVKKNKLFYFFSYEATRERTGSFANLSVAPEDFRRGDFSRFTSLSSVYDPASAAPGSAAQRTPFPGNQVPQSRFNPIFPNIYRGVPLPNQTSFTDPNNLSGNYGISGVLKLNRNQYDFKMNYNVTSKLAVWGKYSRMDAPVSGVYPFGDLGGPAIGTDGAGDTTVQLITSGYNYTLSPTMVMDGVFGYTPMNQTVSIPGQDKNVGLDVWRIPGTNGGRQFANDPRYGGLPNLDGFGFTNLGVAATWTPLFRRERSVTYQQNFGWIKGKHDVRFGFEPRRLMLDHWQPETANPRGSITMAGAATNIPTQVGRAANSFAAALLGLVDNYGKSIQLFEMVNREWQLGWYVRDRWQATRNLTVNLGLRYEYFPLITRGDRGIERWDPATNIVYLGGLGNTPKNAGITTSKKLFAPRVGFAYRLGSKSVMRAGYGITYDPVPFSRPLRGLYPATITGSFVTSTAFSWFNNINEGIPDIAIPDTSRGQLTLPPTVDMGPRSPWGGQINRGYVQSWNFTLEREIWWGNIVSAGYVATRTINQLLDRNINTIGPGGALNLANLPLAQAHGRRIGANMWDGWGYAAYDSLQVTARKSSPYLSHITSFTWGKALNMADDTGWAGPKAFNWEPMLSRNYSPASYDRRYSFTSAIMNTLPFGKGKKFNVSSRALDMIVGGWSLNTFVSAYTGTPFTVTGSGASLQCVGCSQTAHQIGPVRKLGGKGLQQPYFDPSSFRDPLFYFNSANPQYIPGSMGWNPLYGPGFWRVDPGLFKKFKVTEKFSAEFRAEATNILHTARWGNPSGASAAQLLRPDGSLDTSRPNPLQNFMAITSADSTRQFRFGLRLAF